MEEARKHGKSQAELEQRAHVLRLDLYGAEFSQSELMEQACRTEPSWSSGTLEQNSRHGMAAKWLHAWGLSNALPPAWVMVVQDGARIGPVGLLAPGRWISLYRSQDPASISVLWTNPLKEKLTRFTSEDYRRRRGSPQQLYPVFFLWFHVDCHNIVWTKPHLLLLSRMARLRRENTDCCVRFSSIATCFSTICRLSRYTVWWMKSQNTNTCIFIRIS